MSGFEFKVIKEDERARLGLLRTSHGQFRTPVFMPVGTNANVKLMRPSDLYQTNVDIILSNTFHLYLKPGMEVIRLHGGLHNFMKWERSILTDSGGFQVFSLKTLDISDEGVKFKSPIDGSEIFMSPEISMEVQKILFSDIAMAFDHCPAPNASYLEAEEATERTYKWAKRSRELITPPQALFGIVQGGLYEDLRRKSAIQISSLEFEGFAVGGLSIGEPRPVTLKFSEISIENLPADKPRYFMGAGSPELIIELIDMGYDMFDSVFPTRLARHGNALTWNGRINLRSSKYRHDLSPIDETCNCYTCKTFTKAYIHHLFSRKEGLGQILLTLHNINFMIEFMKKVRKSIEEGNFKKFKEKFLNKYLGR